MPPTPEVLILNPDATLRGTVRVVDPVALAANATHVYVASAASNCINVIDVAERGIATILPLGSGLGNA
jgi:hypothetical protein